MPVKQVDVLDLRKSLDRNARKSWTPFDDLIDALGIFLILKVQRERLIDGSVYGSYL